MEKAISIIDEDVRKALVFYETKRDCAKKRAEKILAIPGMKLTRQEEAEIKFLEMAAKCYLTEEERLVACFQGLTAEEGLTLFAYYEEDGR